MLIKDNYPLNGVNDSYSVSSDEAVSIPTAGLTIDYISWVLVDSTHTALSSDALPVTEPTLTKWDRNDLAISGYDSLGHGIYIQGTVTQAVPEPATSILLLTAGVLLLRRRR